jgi:hypothetical protein
VSLKALKEVDAGAWASGQGFSSEDDGVALVWCGKEFYLWLCLSPSDGLGVFLELRVPCVKAGSGPVVTVPCLTSFHTTRGTPYRVPPGKQKVAQALKLLNGKTNGYTDCCSTKGCGSWEEMEQKLRAASVVHGDGSVQVQVFLDVVE